MKLYVVNNNQKIYLNLTASTRQGLANLIGGYYFFIGDTRYSVNDVLAENDSNSTATGAVVGGAVGALAGPVGILIGGLLGGLIGSNTDEEENAKINLFNRS